MTKRLGGFTGAANMGKSELVTYNGALVVRRPWDCSGGSTGWLLWCFATLTPTLLTRSTALALVTTNNGGGTAPPCSADKLNEHCTRSRSRSACKVVLGRIGGGAGGQCFVAALRAGAGGSCAGAPVLVLVLVVLVLVERSALLLTNVSPMSESTCTVLQVTAVKM